MKLTNFNRSTYYLFTLILLTTAGCSTQAPERLAIDEAATIKISQYEDELNLVENENNDYTPAPAEQTSEELTAKANTITATAVSRYTKTLWKRVFSMYALPEVEHPRVTQEVQNFLRHPKTLQALQRRAAPYLHLILDQLEAKQMPGELALLPMIESAFRPYARSPAEAVGLWQFTPATAVTFGLRQNWWYDGRRDVFASTDAATRYLKKLHKKFSGDWLLALASYNVGPKRVERAIRRNAELSRDTSFWSLDLPEETKAYVPKLLAIAKIFAHAEQYNLPLQPIPNRPFLKAVDVNFQLDLNKAAELAEMSPNEFFNVNPAFNHAITSPGSDSYKLLVTAEHAAAFKRKLAKLSKKETIKWDTHTVKAGEDLESIAKLHDVSIEAIVQINQLQDFALAVGNVLRIPPKSLKPFVKT